MVSSIKESEDTVKRIDFGEGDDDNEGAPDAIEEVKNPNLNEFGEDVTFVKWDGPEDSDEEVEEMKKTKND